MEHQDLGPPYLTKIGIREERPNFLDIWEIFVIEKEESSLSEMVERALNLNL